MYGLAVLMRGEPRAGNAAMGNQSIAAINRPFRMKGPRSQPKGMKLRGILD